MTLEHRISAFVQLGKAMKDISTQEEWPGFSSGMTQEEFDAWPGIIQLAVQKNGWFTRDTILQSLQAWSDLLTESNLTSWLASYEIPLRFSDKKVAIIGAGNIPMVVFHDILSTVLCGHKALVKLSSDDEVLIPAFFKMLCGWDNAWTNRIEFIQGKLEGFDAVIATGSDNSSRYFEYYFRSVPHIIRKNRNSVAVLDGTESEVELNSLGRDIFDYYGLGCRNVTHLYLPEGYDLNKFFQGIFGFSEVVNHNKYANNYDYNKAVWLLNREDLLDNGFILLKKDDAIPSPTGSLYYSFYEKTSDVKSILDQNRDKIQCVVGHGFIPFGEAQCPGLADYADGVDSIHFLKSI
jgi:hypothetical protein